MKKTVVLIKCFDSDWSPYQWFYLILKYENYQNSTNFNDLRLVKILLTTDETREFEFYIIKLLI